VAIEINSKPEVRYPILCALVPQANRMVKGGALAWHMRGVLKTVTDRGTTLYRAQARKKDKEGDKVTMYAYICTDNNLYRVGFYTPSGGWYPESDWPTREEAIEQVHYLNGGGINSNTQFILERIAYLIEGITKAISSIDERQELADERVEISRRSR